MGESKTYVLGNDTNNSVLSLLAPLLSKNGVDPNTVMAMMNNRNGFGNDGSWFIWIIFLFFLMGWGNYGGNRGGQNLEGAGLANLINNDAGREFLMQAINGNQAAINQLSSTLNCDINQVQQAINGVMSNIQNVANTVGQSSLQIINALQQGNMQVAQQLSSGFSAIGYATQQQTCDLQNTINGGISKILAGQTAAEMRELQRDILERDRTIAKQDVIINNGQQTAIFTQMIQQAVAPILAGLNGLQQEVSCIKCGMPKTTTVPYTDVVAVPSCVAAQYGLGLGLGLNANGIWG